MVLQDAEVTIVQKLVGVCSTGVLEHGKIRNTAAIVSEDQL